MLAPRSRRQQDAQNAPGRLTDADKRAIAVGSASLYELADRLAQSPRHHDDDRSDEIEAVYRSWNAAYSPGNAVAFERRLDWDGLTPARARQAIAGSFVDDRHVQLPNWLTWLDSITDDAAAFAGQLADGMGAELDSESDEEHPFI